ncbi:MAG: ABC transporter ATP-binding protein [Acidimicrobiales bacterium]
MTALEPDEVHDVNPDAALDLTGDERVDAWRGVNVEDIEEGTGGLAGLLRSRSRALLADLVRPHHRALVASFALIGLSTACQLAVPWLIQQGIDKGIPPLLDGGNGSIRPLVTVVLAVLVVTIVGAITFNAFLLLLGRVGQDVVLDVRQRLYQQFQRLSTAFHERYTSGRVISRQTSDVEAIADLLGHGLINLVTSGLLIVGIGLALMLLDLRLALVTIAAFPVLFLMTRWFRSRAERAYRATREAVALVIVHFVESLGGIHAVHAFRREPRNQEIFEHLDDRYRLANNWSQRLAAAYGPGVQFVGRLMTAIVLLYGSSRVLDGEMTVGVLAAFLLYLRRFFAPMEELSQFYNLFQAASAAREKLSGGLEEPATGPEPSPPLPPHPRARSGSRRSSSATGSAPSCTTSISPSRPVRPWPWWERPEPGRPPWPDSRPGSGTRREAGCSSTASTCATSPRRTCAEPSQPSPRRASSSPGPWPTTSAWAAPTRRWPTSRPPPRPSAPTTSSPPSPTVTTPTSTRRGPGCRPVSANSCRSPGPSWPILRCSSSTRPPHPSTCPRNASCSAPCRRCWRIALR